MLEPEPYRLVITAPLFLKKPACSVIEKVETGTLALLSLA